MRTEEFRAKIHAHCWPGNVRELRNYVERCLALGAQPTIDSPRPGAATPAAELFQPLKLARESFDKRYLDALLERYGNNMSEAAPAAGIDRASLYRMLWRHGLRFAKGPRLGHGGGFTISGGVMLRNTLVLLSFILAPVAASGAINVFPQCQGVPGNLIQNCGFETGDFNGWRQSGDTSFTFVTQDARHSGTFGAKVGPVDFPGFLTQVLQTTPGQSYLLSFWLRSSGQPNQFMIYWDGAQISSSSNLPATATPLAADVDTQYVQMALNLPAAGGPMTTLTFGFFNPRDYFFFDDVVVVPSVGGAQAPKNQF